MNVIHIKDRRSGKGHKMPKRITEKDYRHMVTAAAISGFIVGAIIFSLI